MAGVSCQFLLANSPFSQPIFSNRQTACNKLNMYIHNKSLEGSSDINKMFMCLFHALCPIVQPVVSGEQLHSWTSGVLLINLASQI